MKHALMAVSLAFAVTAAPVANAGVFGWFGELMASVAVFVGGCFD